VSNYVKIQAEMFFESGECATQGCINGNELDNVTIRTTAKVTRVELLDLADPNAFTDCLFVDGGNPTGSGSLFYCFATIPWTSLISWDLADFNLYRLTSQGPSPGFFLDPAVVAGGTHPNTIGDTSGTPAVAAVVDCRGLPSAAPVRWALDVPLNGPCYIDTEYSLTICSARGKISNNAAYQDDQGLVMPDGTIFKDVFCPTN